MNIGRYFNLTNPKHVIDFTQNLLASGDAQDILLPQLDCLKFLSRRLDSGQGKVKRVQKFGVGQSQWTRARGTLLL